MKFFNRNFLFCKKISFFSCLLLTFFLTNLVFCEEEKTVTLTVFIHGTVGSTFSFFSPLNLSGDVLDESTASARVVNRFRNHKLMGYDHICGAEGFHEFFPQPSGASKDVSQYLIPVYNDIMGISGLNTEIQSYAVFGWSGLLHNAARKKAGYELYQALCNYREKIVSEHGIHPEITLVTHSHGANVALYMAQAEIEQQKHLKIKCLVMYGSPMLSEMAQSIESDMFKTIIMLYSQGDGIQLRDSFSSKQHKSHQRMADIVDVIKFNNIHTMSDGKLKRYDLCCFVDADFKRITHTNMWLVGRSIPISKSMNLLPLMVLTPAIIACIHQVQDTCDVPFLHAELHMKESEKLFQVLCIQDGDKSAWSNPCQELLKERLAFWDTFMLNEWQEKDDVYRHPLFNKKSMQILRSALWGS